MKVLLCLFLLSSARAAEFDPATLGVVMSPVEEHNKSRQDSSAKEKTASKPESGFSVEKSTPLAVEPETKACPGPDVVFLPTGFTFAALLPDAIYSYNTAVPVVALLEDDVKFRNKIVLPRGTHLVGNASALHTFDRVNINFTLTVLPEGCEFNISGIAISADDGSAGIKGKLEKHEDSIAAQVLLKSALAGASVAANTAAPVEGAVTSGISNEASQNLDANISKVKSLESINVREHTEIRVFVLRRFIHGS